MEAMRYTTQSEQISLLACIVYSRSILYEQWRPCLYHYSVYKISWHASAIVPSRVSMLQGNPPQKEVRVITEQSLQLLRLNMNEFSFATNLCERKNGS